ncbi:MAG TPA: four helix bundle protein [Gemmatimonadaceae bacterium]
MGVNAAVSVKLMMVESTEVHIVRPCKTLNTYRRGSGRTRWRSRYTRPRPTSRAGHAHLRSQLTRAADGISTNIAEGCGASTTKEFARFLDISIKSANETEHHLLSARDLDLFSPEAWQKFTAETIEIRKMTHGYRKKVIQTAEEVQ